MSEILSYNTQFGKKIEQQSDWIRSLSPSPDVICYQEYPAARLKDAGSLLPPNYDHRYAPTHVRKRAEYGELTAFNTDTMRLVSSKALELGVNGLEKTLGRNLSRQRSGLVTTFEHEGKRLIVANIHLSWFALNKKRREQLGIVIGEFSDPDTPGIIIGDFNYTNFVAGSGLPEFMRREGFHQAGEEVTTHHFHGIRHQLDYIFQRNCTVLELKVADVRLSDHLPLLLQFQPNL